MPELSLPFTPTQIPSTHDPPPPIGCALPPPRAIRRGACAGPLQQRSAHALTRPPQPVLGRHVMRIINGRTEGEHDHIDACAGPLRQRSAYALTPQPQLVWSMQCMVETNKYKLTCREGQLKNTKSKNITSARPSTCAQGAYIASKCKVITLTTPLQRMLVLMDALMKARAAGCCM
eukprot:1157537-Pelagomonas_calceolata.AAC.4